MKIKTCFAVGVLLLLTGCNKFLEEKSDKKLVVPHTLQDFQALMDNTSALGNVASEGEQSTDDYYVRDIDLVSLPESEQALYRWSAELPNDDRNGIGWQYGYREVYYCNLVLEGLLGLGPGEKNSLGAKDIMGQAHLKRGVAMFAMAEIWTPGYNPTDLGSPYGLPIRQNTNFNEKSARATVGETYAFIEENLLKAKDFLPIKSISKFRPTKAAAYGYLARLSLLKNDYGKALAYADSCMAAHEGNLLDFGTLDPAKRYGMPLPENNPEVIFMKGQTAFILGQTIAKISPDLLDKYEDNDYRKGLFFYPNSDGTKRFKGSYWSSSSIFAGMALNEIYLIKIESFIRTEKLAQAKTLASEFIKKRYRLSGSMNHIDVNTMTKDQLLEFTLQERRKELLFRGLRWSDVKRLNKLGYNLDLQRYGSTIKLPANDLRFTLPIPQKVIDVTGLLENER